jgi:hypothetical protein
MVRVLFGAWVIYLALAQPGLPACWLDTRACEFHPHFSKSQAENPHQHDYLFDLIKASVDQALPVSLIPISLLIELCSLITLFRKAVSPALFDRKWVVSLDPPPPRLIVSL